MIRYGLLTLLSFIVFTGSPSFAEPRFKQVLAPQEFIFPRAHGAHPDYATEWWYFTGHLQAKHSSRSYGIELVFFRVGIGRERESASAWAANSLYLAHAALTDDSAGKFSHQERRSRGSFSEAGADETTLRVWLRDWRAELVDEEIRLQFSLPETSVALNLVPSKPIVRHGDRGFSKKGPGEGEASYYTSFTRLKGAGVISRKSLPDEQVEASAWFDHEVTSAKIARGTLGWDWFAVQLETGEELMLYNLRTESGGRSEFSSGTFVNSEGSAVRLSSSDFQISVTESWKSPKTGIVYPSRWRLTVPRLAVSLDLLPTVADQELQTDGSTGVTYWEGRTKVNGEIAGKPSSGAAYVELVGYK